MKKLNLDIQRFSSTNKTTYYELPQFVGTDKPTWLGDFNSAMGAIDTAIHTNASDISTMATDVATATSTASQASSDVSTLTTTVNGLSSDVSSVTTTANNASSTATSALSTANTANGKADTNATSITAIDGRVSAIEGNYARVNLLWTNSSPTSSISANTRITLSSSDYNMLIFYYVYNTNASNADHYYSAMTIKGKDASMCAIGQDTGYLNRRRATYVDATHYDLSAGKGSNDNAEHADICIPICVYGIKY